MECIRCLKLTIHDFIETNLQIDNFGNYLYARTKKTAACGVTDLDTEVKDSTVNRLPGKLCYNRV